jgi:hypothetical protein
MLAAVEELTDIMYFDVLQLLGQGCNGAVFKVGRARVCVFFVFVLRGASCLLGCLLACLLHFSCVNRQKWCTRPCPKACSWR